MYVKRMTFDDWAQNLGLLASTYDGPNPPDSVKKAWRCEGPCGQLMYGIERRKGKNYPSPEIPVGSVISSDYQRVCQVCWEMHHVLDDRRYWKSLSATEKTVHKKLSPGGNYFAT